MWTDDERRDAYTKLYNERFNTNVPRFMTVLILELVNASEAVKLRPHPEKCRMESYSGRNLPVRPRCGAGRCWPAWLQSWNQKRMGFLSKPMIVVPDHLLHQVAR